MARSTVDTLVSDINKILDEYVDNAGHLTAEAVKKVSKKGVEALKTNSKTNFGGTGKYASGWTSKVEDSRMGARATLYNSKVPGLPHLLENGHAKRNGGRIDGKVHIKPVEDEIEKALTQELERKL